MGCGASAAEPPPNPVPSHEGYYLSGYGSGGDKAYQSLEAATAACLSDPEAGGITKEGDTYTVRAGTELKASPSGETSWLKTELPAATEAKAQCDARTAGAQDPAKAEAVEAPAKADGNKSRAEARKDFYLDQCKFNPDVKEPTDQDMCVQSDVWKAYEKEKARVAAAIFLCERYDLGDPAFEDFYPAFKANEGDLLLYKVWINSADSVEERQLREETGGIFRAIKAGCRLNDASCEHALEEIRSANVVVTEMLEAFKNLDKDGNGYINITELRELLIECGHSEEEAAGAVDQHMKEADTNGDRRIEYAEFAKMMES